MLERRSGDVISSFKGELEGEREKVPLTKVRDLVCEEPLVCTFSGDTATGPPLATPQWAQQHHHSPTDDVLNSQADFRLQAHMQAPPPPLDEETPMEDVGQEAGSQAADLWDTGSPWLRDI